MRILVVDDEPDVRTTTKMLLELYGHAVETAANGAEAVRAAAARLPDAVLLDLNMPVMDGFTAARKLRKIAQNASLLIVAVSAYVSAREWCDRAIAAGADDCIGKPLEYSRLELLLNRPQRSQPNL
jgi:CheY-like chemotaxis protein